MTHTKVLTRAPSKTEGVTGGVFRSKQKRIKRPNIPLLASATPDTSIKRLLPVFMKYPGQRPSLWFPIENNFTFQTCSPVSQGETGAAFTTKSSYCTSLMLVVRLTTDFVGWATPSDWRAQTSFPSTVAFT